MQSASEHEELKNLMREKRGWLSSRAQWFIYLFIYFGQKTIEQLKSEDIVPLPVHGFVSQQLFLHLISPSTPSANKCKQIHNTTGAFYCCHPPWQNHSCIFLFVCVLHQVRTSSCHVWGSVLHFLTANSGVRQNSKCRSEPCKSKEGQVAEADVIIVMILSELSL